MTLYFAVGFYNSLEVLPGLIQLQSGVAHDAQGKRRNDALNSGTSTLKSPAWRDRFTEIQCLPTQSTESPVHGFLIPGESRRTVLICSCRHSLKFYPVQGVRQTSLHVLKRKATPP